AEVVVEPTPVVEAEPVEAAIEDPYYEVKAAGDVESFTLTIVHTNDTHGRLEEGKYDGMGFAKIATVIEYVNSVSETTLILDAGDTFHGTNAATLSEGESIAKLMDGTYDALAPGNHDFNYGVDQLLTLDGMTDFPFLSANVTKAGELLFQPYKIFEYNGVKVAVVGLTTPETAYKTHPKNVEGIYFDQPPAWALTEADEYGKVSLAETAVLIQAGVDLLRKEADMVIVLAHIGMDEESAITSTLLAENIDGIDLIIDGHSHTELPEGMVVNGTVIAQAGQYGKNVGIINVEVAGGEITGITPFLYTKAEAAEIEPNAAVAAYIEEVNAEVESFTMQEIATLPYALDGERAHVRTRPTNLTKILTTAMMETTGADAALTNGGGIRASIDAGNVTIGEVITVLPFNNTIVVIEVTGAELLAAIENGIKDLPNPSGAYSQMGGVEAIWNRFNDPGERLFKVKVGGKLVDPLATYRLATNDFLAAGGDQYTMFADKPLLEEYGLMAEIFGYYLVENFPLED
ncbi:MAG: 5'-nucleotidase C-terminal domain-containing protein, partial [Candidatus Eremiobacteraeota bacterium]|nr:5'-nucleotidase C-terminal domain-containing protein [Candidatus Eremiobacteraeota bacterium]